MVTPPRILKTYDIDGVIYLNGAVGLRPTEHDYIVTGRSFVEKDSTERWLAENDIKYKKIYFNQTPYEEKTRASSGEHKARIIAMLLTIYYNDIDFLVHYEDDPEQINVINGLLKLTDISKDIIKVVHVNTNGMIELENVDHR